MREDTPSYDTFGNEVGWNPGSPISWTAFPNTGPPEQWGRSASQQRGDLFNEDGTLVPFGLDIGIGTAPALEDVIATLTDATGVEDIVLGDEDYYDDIRFRDMDQLSGGVECPVVRPDCLRECHPNDELEQARKA